MVIALPVAWMTSSISNPRNAPKTPIAPKITKTRALTEASDFFIQSRSAEF